MYPRAQRLAARTEPGQHSPNQEILAYRHGVRRPV